MNHLTRRRFLRGLAVAAVGATAAACQPQTVVVKETVQVEVEKEVEKVVTTEVEKIVKETVEVEKVVEQTVVVKETVEKIIEKPLVVTATPAPVPMEDQMSASQVLSIPWNSGPGRGPVPGIDYGIPAAFSHQFLEFFYLTADGELLPALADGFEANADSTVFTFYMNKQAVWSDGKPVTAQDHLDWYHFIFNPILADWPSTYVFGTVKGMLEFLDGEADTIEGIEVLDSNTMQITTAQPEGFFPLRMAWRWSPCARVDQWDYVLDYEFETASEYAGAFNEVWWQGGAADMIVSGPYRPIFLEAEPTGLYTFVQNDMWWGATKPHLTRLEAFSMRDMQTMLLMFENGEIDIGFVSGPPAVLLRRNQPEVFVDTPSYAYAAMYMYLNKEPFDDLDFRKACMYAIDWPKLNEVAWEGQMKPTNAGSFYSSSMPCFDPDHKPYEFDPDKAKEHLAKSKYGPTGETVPKIRINAGGGSPERTRAAQIIQEFWRVHLGVEDVQVGWGESEFTDENTEGITNIQVTSGGAPLPVAGLYFFNTMRSSAYPKQFRAEEDADLTEGFDDKIDALMGMDPTSDDYCDTVHEMIKEADDMAIVIPTIYYKGFYQKQPWTMSWEWGPAGWVNPLDTWLAKR